MMGAQSRLLKAGARVCWRDDKIDQGTITETNWSGVTLKMGQPQRAIHFAQRHGCRRARIQEIIAMNNLKTKTASAEIKCSGCDGTGFPSVAQPAKPGRRIFPPACKQCSGKGRITPA
jgi:hypothetical protein